MSRIEGVPRVEGEKILRKKHLAYGQLIIEQLWWAERYNGLT
jgi:hypothetical protein